MAYIDGLMEKFAAKHALHISLYGADNHKRLTGVHETSSIHKFSYGTGNRAAAFRIPTQVMHDNGKGYVEDRRPASNIDPYIVSSEEILEIFSKHIDNPMIHTMKIGCFARMFNTFSGRSKGTCWLNYEEIKHNMGKPISQLKKKTVRT